MLLLHASHPHVQTHIRFRDAFLVLGRRVWTLFDAFGAKQETADQFYHQQISQLKQPLGNFVATETAVSDTLSFKNTLILHGESTDSHLIHL